MMKKHNIQGICLGMLLCLLGLIEKSQAVDPSSACLACNTQLVRCVEPTKDLNMLPLCDKNFLACISSNKCPPVPLGAVVSQQEACMLCGQRFSFCVSKASTITQLIQCAKDLKNCNIMRHCP